MTLFLISTGEYTTQNDEYPCRFSCFIIEADSPQNPLIQEAIARLVRTTNYDRDEIVVQPLGQPEGDTSPAPTVDDLTAMDTPDMF